MLYLLTTAYMKHNGIPTRMKTIVTTSNEIATLLEGDQPEEKIFLNAKKIFYWHALIS